MIRKIRTLTLAASLLGTCAMAEAINLEVSGDAEITYKTEKTGSAKNAFNEAEVNLYFDGTNKDGVEFHGGFTAYDGVEADNSVGAEITSDLATSEAFVMVPLKDNIKITAGLKEDTEFGTEAFWSADAYWRTLVEATISEGVTVYYEAKKIEEELQADGKGDSDANVVGVSAQLGGLSFGAEYTSTVNDKDEVSENEVSLVGVYAMGSVAEIDVAFEYASQGKDSDGKGFFVSAAKEFENGLGVALAYVNLSDGMTGGGDFAVSEILDGNIDSSATKDTSALVLPVSYAINEKLTTNATLVSADILEQSATSVELGLEYALGEQTTISGVYSKLSGDGATALLGDDQSVVAATLSIEF